MKKLIFISLLFLFSCKTTQVFYHHNYCMDGEIRSHELSLFFEPNKNMIERDEIKTFHIKSNKLSAQLKKIKNQTIECDFITISDSIIVFEEGSWYDYAFITADNDTLYSGQFVMWRYKNRWLYSENVELDLRFPKISYDIPAKKISIKDLKTKQTKEITSQKQITQILRAINSGKLERWAKLDNNKLVILYFDGLEVSVVFENSQTKKNILYRYRTDYAYKMNKKWSRKIKKYLR